ncbi:MAG: platelet-activating factor acetylhydrolase IB subunit [Planctomycetales bacterium]|jgi:lysophospholipase L1-like esterase
MQFLVRTLLILTTVIAASDTGFAEKDQSKAAAPKAVTPEVQTAAWAVKWWQPRHDQKLADLKKMEKVDLLMVGDSITHGWENRGKQVWEEHYAKRNAFNIGFSGDRTEHVLWRLQHDAVKGISPKLAVIMIGTNNTGHRQDPAEETAAGIKAIIAELQKQLPETKILLLAIFPRGAKSDDLLRKLNTSINGIIAGYADGKKVFFLDINSEFLEEDGTLPKSVMPDLLHPHEAGYATWAKAMEPSIAKLLGE